jgi:large subunit ribosomal protein L16
MVSPKNIKYRKVYGPQVGDQAKERKYVVPISGIYGLKVVESGIITERELEAVRRTLKKYLKKGTKIWVCVFPDRSVSSKPTEVRMGKGKGAHEYWAAVVKTGRILFEIGDSHIAEKSILLAAKQAGEKLSLKTVLIKMYE